MLTIAGGILLALLVLALLLYLLPYLLAGAYVFTSKVLPWLVVLAVVWWVLGAERALIAGLYLGGLLVLAAIGHRVADYFIARDTSIEKRGE